MGQGKKRRQAREKGGEIPTVAQKHKNTIEKWEHAQAARKRPLTPEQQTRVAEILALAKAVVV